MDDERSPGADATSMRQPIADDPGGWVTGHDRVAPHFALEDVSHLDGLRLVNGERLGGFGLGGFGLGCFTRQPLRIFFRRRLQIQLVAHRDRLAIVVDGLTQDSRRFLSRMKAFAVFADDVIQSPHRFALQFTNRAGLFLDRATGLHLDDCVEHFRHRRSGPVD